MESIGVSLHWMSRELTGKLLGVPLDKGFTFRDATIRPDEGLGEILVAENRESKDYPSSWSYAWPCLQGPGVKAPLPHQVNGAVRILSSIWANDADAHLMFHGPFFNSTFLVADQVGAGKTIMAIMILGYLAGINKTNGSRALPAIMHQRRGWLMFRGYRAVRQSGESGGNTNNGPTAFLMPSIDRYTL